jgi:hypothetical protein
MIIAVRLESGSERAGTIAQFLRWGIYYKDVINK